MNWIKIEFRLPDIWSQVIVVIKDDDGSFSICAMTKEKNNEFFNLETGEELEDITHWMPLPSPPKE